MAPAAMTSGGLDPPVAPGTSKVRLHAEGVRIVVVNATSEGPSLLGKQLGESSFEVSEVPVGRSMVDELLVRAPDLVVIAHSSRAFDIARVCHDISESVMARVIVVSARETASEWLEVAVLDSGADDFLISSISKEVLFARVRAALRRRPAPTIPQSSLTIGDVLIDLQAHALFIGGTPVKCSPLQFLLLVVLAKRSNQVVDARHLTGQRVGRRSRHRRSAPRAESPSACSVACLDLAQSGRVSRPSRTSAIDSQSARYPRLPNSRLNFVEGRIGGAVDGRRVRRAPGPSPSRPACGRHGRTPGNGR